MANHEDYLDALTAFARDGSKEIPPILEQYLNGVAKNGETLFQWPLLKPLIVGKIEQVIEELQQGLNSENIPSRPNVENVRFDVMRTRIMDAVHRFTGAPFTIQRLCELLIDPRRHYKRSDKFMRGLEKNVLVVSTVDPFGRKVVSEAGNKHLVNGMDNGSPFFPRDSSLSSSLPPVPGWVTTAADAAARSQGSPPKAQTQESVLASNGVANSMVTPIFGDQGDQPPVVHAEEVVETVVSVEAGETGPEATGAGEAMAEDEEEMGTEDTNASSSSSSSSSSEDLSNSDTGGSPSTASTPAPVVTSSSSETPLDNRPWASIADEGENKQTLETMELESTEPRPDTSKSSDSEQQEDSASVSQSPPPGLSPASTDAPSSMETTTASTSSHTGPPAEKEEELATTTESDRSLGFVPSASEDNLESAGDRLQATEEGGKDIPSSSSSPPTPVSCTDTEAEQSNTETVSGESPDSDSREQNMSVHEESKEVAPQVETSAPAASVTSTEAATDPGKDVSSSRSLHSETEDGEPQAKQRRLSAESDSSSSSTQDSEQPSSSSATPRPPSSVTPTISTSADTDSGSPVDTTSRVGPVSPKELEPRMDELASGDSCLPEQTSEAGPASDTTGTEQDKELTADSAGDSVTKQTKSTESDTSSEPMEQD